MKMNIINCIIIGLISISLVLFLFYENPFLTKKNKEGFETTNNEASGNSNNNNKGTTTTEAGATTTTEAGATTTTEAGATTTTEAGATTTTEAGATTTTEAGAMVEVSSTTTTTEPVSKVSTSLLREYVKTIFSMEKITVNDGENTITDAIKKNIIFTTKKIKDKDTDFIEIYDIEDDTGKIDEIVESASNDNLKEFIKKIRLIGSNDNDFSVVNRDKDFFLNMVNGVSIDIKFTSNYVRDFTDIIETDTLIKELLPSNFEGTEEDKKRYKNYNFKYSNIKVDRENLVETITLEFYKETNINDNYLEMLNQNIVDDKNKCKSIFGTQTIILKIVLNENFEIDPSTKFKDLIENINVSESEFSYQLGFRYIKNSGSEIMPQNGIYNVRLYLQNVEFKTYSMNDWLTSSINKENKKLLNDRLENIITPMFDLDNEIEKRDKVVKRIHDIYRFNKLSNSQNTLRFYNSHY